MRGPAVQTNHGRRRVVRRVALALALLASPTAARAAADRQDLGATTSPDTVILLDVDESTDLEGLVASMKALAGPRVPTALTDRACFEAIAKTLVDELVANRIPRRWLRLSSPSDDGTHAMLSMRVGASTPTLVYFRLFGLVFGMPLARFASIVFGSLWILHAYVERELAERDAAGQAPPGPAA